MPHVSTVSPSWVLLLTVHSWQLCNIFSLRFSGIPLGPNIFTLSEQGLIVSLNMAKRGINSPLGTSLHWMMSEDLIQFDFPALSLKTIGTKGVQIPRKGHFGC